MTGKLQAMIDQANRRSEAGRKKQFVKKATDAQLLNELSSRATVALQAYANLFSRAHVETAAGDLRVAMQSLKVMVEVVDKRVK